MEDLENGAPFAKVYRWVLYFAEELIGTFSEEFYRIRYL